MTLPEAWDPLVHGASFDLLLGNAGSVSNSQSPFSVDAKFPQILPAILASLEHGLARLLELNTHVGGSLDLPNGAVFFCNSTLLRPTTKQF